jgi:hypothetical protein
MHPHATVKLGYSRGHPSIVAHSEIPAGLLSGVSLESLCSGTVSMPEGGSIAASYGDVTIYAPGPTQSSPEVFSAVPMLPCMDTDMPGFRVPRNIRNPGVW